MKSKNIVFFGYCWRPTHTIDLYQHGLVQAFRNCGYNVHIISASDFCAHGSVVGISNLFSVDKIVTKIKSIDPQIIVSMNNGGLIKEVVSGFSHIKILSIIVDEATHLFVPSPPLADNLGKENVHFILTNSDSIKYFKEQLPTAYHKNLHLLPCASEATPWEASKDYKHTICFVGSYLPTKVVGNLLSIAKGTQSEKPLKNLISDLDENYDQDIDDLISKYNLKNFIVENSTTLKDLKYHFSNYISSKLRLDIAHELTPLEFTVYGNKEWQPVLSQSTDFKLGSKIKERQDLLDIYNSSKISIHIAQIQVRKCLSYRIFDILKSRSLLVIPYSEKADAFRFFGKDCPIPMYKNPAELKEICKYYLNNEDMRLKKVEECGKLVEKGYSFDDRIEQYLQILDQPPVSTQSMGKESTVSSESLYKSLPYLTRPVPYLVRKMKNVAKRYILSC